MLQSFEFNADVKDDIIVLPDEYKGKIKKTVKVIIIQAETDETDNTEKATSRKKHFFDFVEHHSLVLPKRFGKFL